MVKKQGCLEPDEIHDHIPCRSLLQDPDTTFVTTLDAQLRLCADKKPMILTISRAERGSADRSTRDVRATICEPEESKVANNPFTSRGLCGDQFQVAV